MIKKILLVLAMVLPLCAWAQAPKFGVVDVESIIPKMPEFVEAQNKINEASKTYETEYGKQDIQELDRKAQQFAATAQQDLQRQQAQLMQPIQEKVMNAIKAVGSENGFLMILPEGSAAYTAPEVQDVTALVRTKLGITDTTPAAAPAK